MADYAWSIGAGIRPRRLCRVLPAMAALGVLALAGCTGGGDGSVGVGSGQQPDPVAVDFPIAYTKGPLFDDQMQLQSNPDLRQVLRFNVGTDLYVRDRASPSAPERNVTSSITEGMGDVQGVQISADGKKVLFAMRGPFDPNLDAKDQPTWNIWEYEIATDTLRRIIASDVTAEAGQDISPHYLPDGRIVFASTRQRQSKAILLDEGKPQFDAQDEDRKEPAFVLHVMDDDGGNLHQISFNQSHDLDPTVLQSGKILFSRWDHAGSVNGVNLYQVNPDGTDLELLYGAESHMTGTNGAEVEFVDAHELPDGRIMAITRPFVQPDLGGAIVTIDTPDYVENTQSIATSPGLTGPAEVPATPNDVTTAAAPSPGGRFSSAFPLWDGTGRVLVSWSICRVVDANGATVPCTDQALADPAAQAAPPLYGIWMYDPRDQTQLPIVTGEEGVLISDVVAAQPRPAPQSIPDKTVGVDLDRNLAAANAGVIDIRSVYDVDGVDTAKPDIATLADPAKTTAAQRPARFLRIVKAVSIPDKDTRNIKNTAFGPDRRQGMREIVGYTPIAPDGSVRVEVPANVALAVSVVDANGRRISARHQNWLQVRPGEELKCNGCHDPRSGLSHGRHDSFASVYAGAAATGVAFPNTIQSGVDAIIPNFGETMAEARTRVSCQSDCAALLPSMDVVYKDVWTDPAVRTPDPRRHLQLRERSGAADDDGLHDEVDAYLPRDHQLRAEHRSALELAPARRERCGPYLQSGRLPRARGCDGCRGRARGAAGSRGRRALAGSDGSAQRLSGAAVPGRPAGSHERRAAGRARADGHRCRRQSDLQPRDRAPANERGRRARIDALLCRIRPGRQPRGLDEPGRAQARGRMARHRRAVLQQPVRRSGQLDAETLPRRARRDRAPCRRRLCRLRAGRGRGASACSRRARLGQLDGGRSVGRRRARSS